ERQLLIHLAALKVTRLAAGLKYRRDVRSESRPFCHCLDRGERRQENERTDEKKTRNKAMPKHQLNIAPITKTRNADSATQHFIRVQVDDESPRVVNAVGMSWACTIKASDGPHALRPQPGIVGLRNPYLRYRPKLHPALLRLSAMISQYVIRSIAPETGCAGSTQISVLLWQQI